MSYDDVRKAERLVLPVGMPQAWNIGPARTPEEEAAELALAEKERKATAHVFGPRSLEVRLHIGRDEPAVMLFVGTDFKAVLWPDQIATIVAHWKRMGIELDVPSRLPRWDLYELARSLARRLAKAEEEHPGTADLKSGIRRDLLLKEAEKFGLFR